MKSRCARLCQTLLALSIASSGFSGLSGCAHLWGTAGPESEDTDSGDAATKSGDSEAKKDEKKDDAPELTEEEYLHRAENGFDRGLYSVARESLSKLRDDYPTTSFESFAQLKIADAYFFAREFTAAIPIYEEFLKLHPGHEAAPYARLQIGNAYLEQYTGPAHDQSPIKQAQSNFERVLSDYPGSYLTAFARKGLSFCKDAVNAHDSFVADFYNRAGKEKATKGRLSSIEQSRSQKAAPGKLELPKLETDALAADAPGMSGANLSAGGEEIAGNTGDWEDSVEKSAPSVLARSDVPEPEPQKPSSVKELPLPDRSAMGPAPENTSPPHVSSAERNQSTPADSALTSSALKENPSPAPTPALTAALTPAGVPASDVAPAAEVAPGPTVTPTPAPSPRATKKVSRRSSPLFCREEKGVSIAELRFAGDFELRSTPRSGSQIGADLVFDFEESARTLAPEATFSGCSTKHFIVRLGLPQETSDGVIRHLSVRFADGLHYRVFPLDHPARLILVAFNKNR